MISESAQEPVAAGIVSQAGVGGADGPSNGLVPVCSLALPVGVIGIVRSARAK